MTGPSLALDILTRALVVLATAGIAHVLLRRAAASVRAGLWTAALAGLLMLPAMSRVLPAWRIEVLRQVEKVQGSEGPRVQAVPRSEGPRVQGAEGPKVQRAEAGASAEALRAMTTPGSTAFPWWSLFAGWLGVAAILFARVLASYVRLFLIAKRQLPSDDAELDAEIERARSRLAITRAVTWRTTDDVSVPAVSGFARATLLLPADAASWPVSVKRAVVAHELAHVARWDAAGQLIGQLACAAYWFVPFVWLAARRAATLRERACDDAALQSGVRASTYASTLLLLAEQAGSAPTTSAALPMASPSHIQERVMAILDPSVRRHAVTFRAAIALIVAGTGVVLAAATIEPARKINPTVPDAVTPALAARASSEVANPAPDSKQSVTRQTPPPQPPPPAPPSTATRLCDGASESSSTSIHEDDGARTWTIKVKGTQCSVDFRLDGKVEFNDDFTDIASISAGGFLRLDVTDHGVRHELELKPGGGSLQRTWRVDGRDRPYDNEAKAWFAAFLIDLDRTTGVGVDRRLPQLLRKGGVTGVLEETGQMSSDYVRGIYYQKLAGATKLSPADITRIIQQATSLKTSDFYATELLKAFISSAGDDAASRTAMVQLIATMESDFYIMESAKAVAGRTPMSAREVDLLTGLLPRIKSDFYKAEFIRSLTAGGAGSKTIVDAASGIKEDFYLSETYALLTAKVSLTEADLLAMVDRAGRIASDFYAAETLRRLAAHKSATARVRQAVTDAAQHLSTFYRDQVVRAAGGKG